MSAFWTEGRLWTFRVLRVGKAIGVGRQTEQRQKMKMLCLYLEQQTNTVLNLTCNLLTQRQRNMSFFSFTSVNSNLALIPCAWCQCIIGPYPLSQVKSGSCLELMKLRAFVVLGHCHGAECMPCLGHENIYCYQGLFFAWGSLPGEPCCH